MDTDIVVALLVFGGTIVTSIYGARRAVDARIDKLLETIIANEKALALQAIKIDLLWEIYAEDAVREARAAQLVRKNSPVEQTEQWYNLISTELQMKLLEEATDAVRITSSPYDAAVEIYAAYRHELNAIADENDISYKAIFGAVVVLCQRLM